MLIRKCPRCGKYDNALNRVPISKNEDGTYRFEIIYTNNCPFCGSLYMDVQKKYQNIIRFIGFSDHLDDAVSVFLDGHNDSAIREASIALEDVIRQKSGLNEHGKKLVGNAFSYKDESQPLIALNNLETESERNEQEGVQLMLLGFFQSIRNISAHMSVGHGSFQTFEILCMIDFFLKIIEGDSFTKRARWIRVDASNEPIIMPKLSDRIKLKMFSELHSLITRIRSLGK